MTKPPYRATDARTFVPISDYSGTGRSGQGEQGEKFLKEVAMIHVRFSHLDYNVPDLAIAREFYDPLFEFLGFVRETEEPGWILYANGDFKICLVQCEERFKGAGFHRKKPGLNHLAFEVDRREEVDRLHRYLLENNIPVLYGGPGNFHPLINYYAVFFEDPFRLKLEVVFSPEYQRRRIF
jgi:catechol 2,3-dioxygenase-like lactoylglutathione lyase family enzyme